MRWSRRTASKSRSASWAHRAHRSMYSRPAALSVFWRFSWAVAVALWQSRRKVISTRHIEHGGRGQGKGGGYARTEKDLDRQRLAAPAGSYRRVPLADGWRTDKTFLGAAHRNPRRRAAGFATYVDALIAETGTIPYLVLTPSFASFIVHTTEKLVCCLDDELRIYECIGDEPRLTAFHFVDVDAVEVGCVLLKSWIKIVGKDTGGVKTKITIKFNTVTDYLFLPVINKLRRAGQSRGRTAARSRSRPSSTIWRMISTNS